jgi:hypothetical protein
MRLRLELYDFYFKESGRADEEQLELFLTSQTTRILELTRVKLSPNWLLR